MNASLSVRLYNKQKKIPGYVSNKRPVIWHLQDVRVWEEKENVKGNKCKRQKKIEDKITNRRKLWSQKDSEH